MQPKKDNIGISLIAILFLFLIIAGIISSQSIDWTVLKRLEQQQLILPTPIPSPTSTDSSKTK